MPIRRINTSIPEDRRDCFATWHRFPEGYAEHVKAHGTVSGYDGPSYADFLLIDFDGEDLALVHSQVREFLKVIELTYEIDGLLGVRVYFSGAKGFHVCLSSVLFGGWGPSPELHGQLKELSRLVTDGFEVDTAIYDQNRLLRVPNTVNSKSGLYKIPLEIRLVLHQSIDDIRLLAESSCDVTQPDWDDVSPSQVCQDLWERVRRQKPHKGSSVDVGELFPRGLREGDGRDNQAFKIARYCRDHGFPEAITDQLLAIWDLAQTDPLGRKVLDQKVRSAYSRLDGASSPDLSEDDILGPDELAQQYDAHIEKLSSSKISLGLGPVDGRLRGICRGEVTTIIAKPGAGKTALVQNILRHVADAHDTTTLFCSLEQPLAQVFERYAQMGYGRSGEEIERGWEEPEQRELIATTVRADLGKRTLTCGKNLSLAQLDQALDLAAAKAGEPVSVLALDYLGLLDTRDLDKTLYGQASRAARELKNLAKRRDVAVLCLCQVGRSAGEDASAQLSIHSARESGAIEESADFLLGLYRPDLHGEDRTINIQILKNRKGEEGVEFSFDFDKTSLRITPKVTKIVGGNGDTRHEY
jgi:KaiC/GvpD/RAD55 family RecA-like ATPase